MAWLPVAATGLYYGLPPAQQEPLAIQFLPQGLAYLGLALWAARNRGVAARLGLGLSLLGRGVRWGLLTGLVLGCLNTAVILWIVPALGGDIQFLRETPHARMPAAVMRPWAIMLIAVGVELNFRGFLLGRLLALWQSPRGSRYHRGSAALAIAVSALVFAYDPFLVATFRHLHWIAVWDGAVWGTLRVGLGTLYAPIVAHAVEVLILYSILRTVLA